MRDIDFLSSPVMQAKVAVTEVKDHIYTKEEYKDLITEQKKALHEKCKTHRAAHSASGDLTDAKVAAL
jgi:hypothetical protein